jgi:hypothetical protein
MTKRRTIEAKIRASETFACLTYRQRDLWIGLILVCDDQGRLPGQAAYVRSAVWPYDDVLLADVEADLAALESLGNIMRYQAEGRTYIQLVNWHKYQADSEWLGRSEYPAPDGWIDHARYHGKGNVILTLNWENRKASATLKQGSSKVGEQEQQTARLPCDDGDVNVKGNGNVDVKVDDDVKADDDDEEEADGTPQAAAWGGFSGPATIQEARDVQARIRMAASKMCRVDGIMETEIARIIYQYPENEITDSIHIAIRNRKPTWAYVLGILKRKAEADAASVKRADYIDAVER